jgi:hypothetical protein
MDTYGGSVTGEIEVEVVWNRAHASAL